MLIWSSESKQTLWMYWLNLIASCWKNKCWQCLQKDNLELISHQEGNIPSCLWVDATTMTPAIASSSFWQHHGWIDQGCWTVKPSIAWWQPLGGNLRKTDRQPQMPIWALRFCRNTTNSGSCFPENAVTQYHFTELQHYTQHLQFLKEYHHRGYHSLQVIALSTVMIRPAKITTLALEYLFQCVNGMAGKIKTPRLF